MVISFLARNLSFAEIVIYLVKNQESYHQGFEALENFIRFLIDEELWTIEASRGTARSIVKNFDVLEQQSDKSRTFKTLLIMLRSYYLIQFLEVFCIKIPSNALFVGIKNNILFRLELQFDVDFKWMKYWKLQCQLPCQSGQTSGALCT